MRHALREVTNELRAQSEERLQMVAAFVAELVGEPEADPDVFAWEALVALVRRLKSENRALRSQRGDDAHEARVLRKLVTELVHPPERKVEVQMSLRPVLPPALRLNGPSRDPAPPFDGPGLQREAVEKIRGFMSSIQSPAGSGV